MSEQTKQTQQTQQTQQSLMSSLTLRSEQQKAYSLFTQKKNVFVTGPGGTGKTTMIKLYVKMYKNNRNISVTSTTGASALLIGGTTLHSFLGIGLGKQSVDNMIQKIRMWSWLKQRWCSLDCLIIDEVSMLEPDLFDKLEQVARVIRQNDEPFGGIQIILSGDFCQLPCVGTDKFCFEAKCWNKVVTNTVYLNEIIRQEDVVFQKVLNKVRLGKITKRVKKVLNSRVGINPENSFGINPTILYSCNKDVDKVNDRQLDKLASDGRQFFEYEMEIVFYQGVSNRSAAKEKFLKNCTSPPILQLCKDAQVMLLKNLDTENGLVNGSRGVVTGFIGEMPVVKFMNGSEKVIDYNIWEIVDGEKKILRAKQLPLKVAYAVTIHKVQGSTLDYVELDLSDIFEYGQGYVALSRIKSLDSLIILNIDYDLLQAHPKAIEYYESL